MKSVEELFKVDVGRIRSIAEVRAMVEELRPFAKEYRAMWEAASAMPYEEELWLGGPEREAAFNKLDEEFPDGPAHELALDGLNEVLEDLGELEKEIPKSIPDDKREAVDRLVRANVLEIVERHIRNARYWSGVFGGDSYTRIDVFSWIVGVEPNYEPLEEETEEERKIHEEQVAGMAKMITSSLDAADKKETIN